MASVTEGSAVVTVTGAALPPPRSLAVDDLGVVGMVITFVVMTGSVAVLSTKSGATVSGLTLTNPLPLRSFAVDDSKSTVVGVVVTLVAMTVFTAAVSTESVAVV